MQLKQICMWVIVSLAARAIIKVLLVRKKLSGVFLYRTGMILDFLCVGNFNDVIDITDSLRVHHLFVRLVESSCQAVGVAATKEFSHKAKLLNA